MTRFGVWTILAVGVLSVTACGGSSTATTSPLDRACSSTCAKMIECTVTVGTMEACVDMCRQNASSGSGSSTCDATEAEASACIAAVSAADCSAFTTGSLPEECDICEDADDGGIGLADSGLTDAGVSSGTGCARLATCCATLPTAQQNGCNGLVASGNDSLCATTLTGYQTTSSCSGI